MAASSKAPTPIGTMEVKGGRHAWPGASQYLPTGLVGGVSRDLDASEAIATFFKSRWGQTSY
jgi:poly(3-hydroxybutyrate) depolymerase